LSDDGQVRTGEDQGKGSCKNYVGKGETDEAYEVSNGDRGFCDDPRGWKFHPRFRWRGDWPTGDAERGGFWFRRSHRRTGAFELDLLL
jgi:hypothetical protein